MSVCFDEKHREQYERENAMYHRILQDGKLDKNGYLVEPPSDMTDEEKDYYNRLLRERNGKIQYTV